MWVLGGNWSSGFGSFYVSITIFDVTKYLCVKADIEPCAASSKNGAADCFSPLVKDPLQGVKEGWLTCGLCIPGLSV